MESAVISNILLLFLATLAVGNELHVPTHGEWQGHAPGTWVVTRFTTRYFQTNKADRVCLFKRILLGEDKNGGVHVVNGECDKDHEYVQKPHMGIHQKQPAWYGPVVRVETNTVLVGTAELKLLDKIAVTNTVQDGKRTYTRRMLADRPDFMVAFRNEMSDQFRGELYHMVEEETPLSVTTKNRFENNCIGR